MATVALGRPIDLQASLAPFGRSGDDLLDRFDGQTLVRSFRLGPDDRPVACMARVPAVPAETLAFVVPAHVEPARAERVIGGTFVADETAVNRLAVVDRRVAALAARYPGLVPVLVPDPFHAVIRSISAQQVNLRWAATVRARLAERYGARLEVADTFVHVLDADALARASSEELRELQLTNAKARAVVATARAARDGELNADELAALDDEALIAYLTRLPGIGRWSAEWFLARTLGRPRVVAGDLGVRKAVGRLYDVAMPTELEVRRLTEHWADAATLAQALALHDLAVSPGPAPAR
jgi:DNA-3-methyladenine glycosylase II